MRNERPEARGAAGASGQAKQGGSVADAAGERAATRTPKSSDRRERNARAAAGSRQSAARLIKNQPRARGAAISARSVRGAESQDGAPAQSQSRRKARRQNAPRFKNPLGVDPRRHRNKFGSLRYIDWNTMGAA